MSKRRLLTAVIAGILAGVAHSASAGDLAVPYAKGPPVFTWSGCYVGGQVGVGVLQDGYTGAVNPSITPLGGGNLTGPVNQWGVGGTFGGYVGCNYQMGQLVVGVEADSWWSSLKVESNTTTFNSVIKASTTNPWAGDVAGRIGVAFGEYLMYTKAGVAFGSFRYSLTSTNNVGVAQSGNAASVGFIGGFGLEYAIMPDVT